MVKRYHTVPSVTLGSALLQRRNTVIHFFKITNRIAIVWGRKDHQ